MQENTIDFDLLSQEEQNAILRMLGSIQGYHTDEVEEKIPDDFCEVLSVE